jgi:hypothetical protein
MGAAARAAVAGLSRAAVAGQFAALLEGLAARRAA